jgi:hypothetical protein
MVAFATMRRPRTASNLRSTSAGGLLLGAIVLALVIVAQSGCSKDDAAGRTSRRGEVCQVARDCEDGLFCAPVPNGSGGVCVTGSFKIVKTAKSCVLLECTGASDCCTRGECDGGTGIDCEMGKCVFRCTDDTQCSSNPGAPQKCSGGKCVQCTSNGDCGGGACVNGQCQPGCTNDGACGGFDRCVDNRCIPSGCQTDRECVAATRNVDARCGTDGKCIVPCETDLECGSPTNFQFFACIDKQCTYVGCDSDKDCRLFFTGPSDASTLPSRETAVCQDNGVLGDVVKPAQ